MAAQTTVPGCTRHPGMGFVYICKTCGDELLCMDCVVDQHNTHTLGKITDYVSEQKRQIQEYQEKLSKTDVPKIENDIQANAKNSKENDEDFSKMVGEIKRQGKQMKISIDSIIDRLEKLSQEIKLLNADIIEENKTALTTRLRDIIKPNLDRCQQVLTSGTNTDVITAARDIRGTPAIPPTLGKLTTAVFKPGTISTDLLERMLGTISVNGEDPTYTVYKPTVTVVSEFKTPFTFNACVACPTGDETWLSYWEDTNIHRVDQVGHVKQTIECNVKVRRIAVSPNTGTLWVCHDKDLSIREITKSGKIITRFTVDSHPCSLCITTDNKVIVGMLGSIRIYDSDGKKTTSSGAGGKPCIQQAEWPMTVADCTQTGDVVATDTERIPFDSYVAGKYLGRHPRVIVMDHHLNIKFQYTQVGTPHGHDSPQPKFYPNDACFDGSGDVLIADMITETVFLIDGNTGRHIRTIYTSPGQPPTCISRQKNGVLWVGHKGERIKIIKYKD